MIDAFAFVTLSGCELNEESNLKMDTLLPLHWVIGGLERRTVVSEQTGKSRNCHFENFLAFTGLTLIFPLNRTKSDSLSKLVTFLSIS